MSARDTNSWETAIAKVEHDAAMSRRAVTAAKNAVNRAFEVTLAEGIRFERQAFVS